MTGEISNITAFIRDEAFRIGFLDCGFSSVRKLHEHEERYQQWLSNEYHAGMEYMERNIDKRLDPSLLVDGAKTVISLLYNYFSSETLTGSHLKISKYAYGKDYHFVVKDKLAELDSFIRSFYPDVVQRCFVDSAPVLERAWAQNSGLGWIGKNSCLISRRYGSFFFICEIITSLELAETTETIHDYCANCTKCIDACPTQAITENRTINSSRCISYQTIENKGELSGEVKGKFGVLIFGCDICQDVCPWNRKSVPHSEPLFHLKDDLKQMTAEDWKNLDESKYQQLFQKSAVKRAKFSGIKRNIDNALNNSTT